MVGQSREIQRYKISEVALILSVGKNTVRKWSDAGLLSSERVGKRRDRVFKLEDVDTFLKQSTSDRSNPIART